MTRISTLPTLAIVLGVFALGACAKNDATADDAAMANEVAIDNAMAGNAMAGNAMAGVPQSFNFIGGDGALLGSVMVSEDPGGLVLNVNGVAMPAGVHGIHLHEKGLCEGPRFETAGAHWNPTGKQHGRDNPAGAHAGDLANLTVAADGSAMASIPVAGATMATGPMMLADADGTALVVHAQPDDYTTDPSGDSGDRIACAVIAAPKGG